MELYFQNYYKQLGSGSVAVMPYDIKIIPSTSLSTLCDYLESIGWISQVLKDEQERLIWVYISPPGTLN